jgi:hypothetical protein
MSTSYVGSDALTSPVTPITIAGFDVLNPTSYAATSPTQTTASTSSSSATSPTQLAASTSSASSNTTGQNPYQQAVETLQQWQYETLFEEATSGDDSLAQQGLYASAGLSATSFANLAYQLQQLGANESGSSTVDTSA